MPLRPLAATLAALLAPLAANAASLDIQQHVLPDGLTVLVLENHVIRRTSAKEAS